MASKTLSPEITSDLLTSPSIKDASEDKKEYKLPTSDLNGWPIEDGVSSNPRLSDEDKINEVVRTMKKSNYPQDFIDNYLSLMNSR